jgi:molybdenum ABC transporter molybdate-binding protein
MSALPPEADIAASLKNALDDAVKKYEAKTGDKVVVSYAASPALAKQIEQAAPADIFFSADLDWMDYLEQRKLIDPVMSAACAETQMNGMASRPRMNPNTSLRRMGFDDIGALLWMARHGCTEIPSCNASPTAAAR